MKFTHVFLGLIITSSSGFAADDFNWLRDDARKDLLKVLHYAIIQLHVHDIEDFDKCADIDSSIEYKYNTD